MNCDWIKENVVLYVYDELADDAKYEFEQHTRHCLNCKQEVESAMAFKEGLSSAPVQEVSPNLLVASRLRLRLSDTEREGLEKVGTKNVDAYKLYLKGRYQYEKYTTDDFKFHRGAE